MSFANPWHALRPSSGTETRSPRAHGTRRSRRTILQLEAVEQRVVLSTVLVSPTGSLGGQPAFTTIQAGVNAAKAGDTVEVAAGTYKENVAVNKPLTILGDRANINPNQSTTSPLPSNNVIILPPPIIRLPSIVDGSFKVTANNVTLNGFTVENPFGTDVADADGVSGFTVVDDVIEDAELGVQLFADHATTVQDNLITGINGDGIENETGVVIIFISPRSTPVATNDVISSNVIQNTAYDGISLSDTNSSQVVNNLVQNTGGYGIYLSDSNGNALQGNVLLGVGSRDQVDGIDVVNSSNNTLQSNQLKVTGANGIELYGGSGNRLTQNTVSQSGSATQGQGFLLTRETNDAILNNFENFGSGAGLEIANSSGAVVLSNTFSNNQTQGVDLLYSSAITVVSNTISNDLVGIALNNVTQSTLGANTVTNNHGQGFVVDNSSVITITGNTVKLNGGDGILLYSVSASTVQGNTLTDNGGNNIDLVGATANRIQGNTATGAKLDGIHLDAKSTGNTVSSNTALFNGLFDAEDDSTGGHTAGTANTWTGNIEVKDNHHGGLGH